MNAEDCRSLTEKLAELEHEQWVSWATSILKEEAGLSEKRRERWERLITTPFKQLTMEEKASDFLWADKVIDVVTQHYRRY
jgi:hypothetical protein